MPPLKLFVSHSSRLDDMEHFYGQDDRNWQLLQATCRAISDKYGERVKVLVDIDGLKPSDDWNHHLNLWLAECHVAIILFSKRAIEKSGWVAKEATILSWRAELDPSFKLIPVMLDGETTPEDLTEVCSGVLQIDRYQCIRNAQTAQDILYGIVQALGEPDDLMASYPLTPLEILQGGIAAILGDTITEASLCLAVEAICGCRPDPFPADKKGCAGLLARQFLQTTPNTPPSCFATFEQGIGPLTPRPPYASAFQLFKYIRPLWVEPADVASLRLAQKYRHPLALNGRLISWSDPDVLKTYSYTLDRFIERAWPGGADKFKVVSLTEANTLEVIKKTIWKAVFGGGQLPPVTEKKLDEMVNRDASTIVLLILALQAQGGLPDPVRLSELTQLFGVYQKIILVFDVGTDRSTLPVNVKSAQPRLDDAKALQTFLDYEYEAFYGESAAKTYLDDNFGSSQ